MIVIGVILLMFAAIAGIAELTIYYEDRSLNRRFRENQRIHHRRTS